MGDISTWNPVDNSNTTAPPDGWPEGMAPSAVNNSARAMMGAVRRWYDTVTAQLAGFLPLTGGTLTGALTAQSFSATEFISSPQYNIGAILFANNASSANILYDSAGQRSVTLGASDTFYDADNHFFRTNAGVNTATINASGNLGVQSINCNGTITAGGTVTAAQLTSTANANIAGTCTAAQLTSTGNINAAGTVTGTSFIGNVSVPANGPVSTGGTVTGGQVTSTGNANVAGTMTAGNVSASSDVTAAGSVTGGSMHCTGAMTVDGQLSVGASGLVVNGPTYNITGSWITLSDRDVKENVVPYDSRGLDAVLALRPVAFNYRADLFGPEEAGKVRYGLVADEVAPVVPEMVGETLFGGRHLSTLNTGHINLLLVNACRDLAAQNAALAARITTLEGTHV